MRKIGLYVHIPFCRSKCDYCNFVSICDLTKMPEYIRCLKKEITMYKKKLGNDVQLYSVYIGGGTPSIVPDEMMMDLINHITKTFGKGRYEFSIECNPGTVTLDKLLSYKKAGINRISIGGQTCNDKLLKLIGRKQTNKDLINAVRLVKEAGFDNINVDMLIGLPKQKIKDIKKMLKFVISNELHHVSAYSLIVEGGTPIDEHIKMGLLQTPPDEYVVKMYDFVVEYLKKHNINRYEVSNFAQEGYECKHNLNYWKLGEYIGVGVSAHSYTDGTRQANVSDISKYISSINNNQLPIATKEYLTTREMKEEYIMLMLRTKDGINLKEYKRLFFTDLEKDKANEIHFLLSNGFIKIDNKHLKVSENSFYVLNSIVAKLID